MFLGRRSICYNKHESVYVYVCVLVAQLSLTHCNPMDCSPPDFYINGIFQARVLEWVAIPFSRGIFLIQGLNLRLLHCRQFLYH